MTPIRLRHPGPPRPAGNRQEFGEHLAGERIALHAVRVDLFGAARRDHGVVPTAAHPGRFTAARNYQSALDRLTQETGFAA